MNANQLFKWRREMAPEELPAAAESVTLLPVAIVPDPNKPRGKARARRSGTIAIAFGSGARVCVRGEVSPETLQRVIELLR